MGDRDRALLSLRGLSVGDAFGERFFGRPTEVVGRRELPAAPWAWTDDTQMALSIVEVLFEHDSVEQDVLAAGFASRFAADPMRDYGGGAIRLLRRVHQGADWQTEASLLFDGGSYGNGGAMRAAPIGGFFAGDPERAAAQARLSAEVTHAHPEGQAGAMAVAAAAALVHAESPPAGVDWLNSVASNVPDCRTREGIERATELPSEDPSRAAAELGSGWQVSAFDTVPFCLWAVAHHGTDFEDALWITVAGGGDMDTTCAIVGGIVALVTGVPEDWHTRREPLPNDFPFAA
jgi:ADP-ribosylglycohydrolase